jgi:hypothetical protein
MSNTDTHLTKSDRVLIYTVFLGLACLTAALYYKEVDGFSRLSLYVTIFAFVLASWAWLAGHYSKKMAKAVQKVEAKHEHLRLVPTQREALYVHKGEATLLAEALGNEI